MKKYWCHMETIKLKKDYKSFKKLGGDGTPMLTVDEVWNGKFLTEDAYDRVVSPMEDTVIYKPSGDIPLAYVVCNAYPDDQVFECLKTIEDTTKMRANASGPIIDEDMKAKGISEYRLSALGFDPGLFDTYSRCVGLDPARERLFRTAARPGP